MTDLTRDDAVLKKSLASHAVDEFKVGSDELRLLMLGHVGWIESQASQAIHTTEQHVNTLHCRIMLLLLY